MEQLWKIIPGMIIPIITSLLTIVFILANRKKKNKKTDIIGIKEGKGKGIYNDLEYTYNYFRNGGKGPVSFTISINCKSSGSFRIMPENKFNKFFVNLGLSKKIRTGDLEFDNKFFIFTPTEDFTRTFFGYRKNRQAVENISNKKFFISHDGKTMGAACLNLKLVDKIDTTFIQEIVSNLIVLSKDIPPFTTKVKSKDWQASIPVFAIPVIFGMAGIVTIVLGLIGFKPLDLGQVIVKSLGLSIPCLFIFLWLSLKLLKGRTSSHIEFLIAAAISLAAFPVAGAGGLIFLNGWLDKSQANSHKTLVVRKYISKSEDDITYYVVLKSWRAHRKTEKISVYHDIYSKIKPNKSEIVITTKPGRFGFEWVYRYELEDTNILSK